MVAWSIASGAPAGHVCSAAARMPLPNILRPAAHTHTHTCTRMGWKERWPVRQGACVYMSFLMRDAPQLGGNVHETPCFCG